MDLIVYSMQGRPSTGSKGLGQVFVNGLSLVPSPPAMMIACLTPFILNTFLVSISF
jgi:hypothetical protein